MTSNNDSDYFCIKGMPKGVYEGQATAYLAIRKTASNSPLQWDSLAATSPEGLGILIAHTLNGTQLRFGNLIGSNSAFLQSPNSRAPVHYHIAPLTPTERSRIETMRETVKGRARLPFSTTLQDGQLVYRAEVPLEDGSTQILTAGSYAGIHRLTTQARRTLSI